MAPFIAIVWNHRADHARADSAALVEGVRAARPAWRRQYDASGLVIFSANQACAAITLAEDSGVILGDVFEGERRIEKFEQINVECLRRSRGEHLFGAVWGRYVAFVRDQPNACVYVVRDPSGAFPCYATQRGWAFAFFSNTEDVEAIALHETAIDWAYLAQRLADNRVIDWRTGLAGVEELPPGAIASVAQGRRRTHVAWTAAEIAAREEVRCPKLAQESLKISVMRACKTLASGYDRIAVRLSGGLDSSIVLAGVVAGAAAVSAVNFVTPTPEGDERRYARAAAGYAHAPLRELMRDPARVDLRAAVRHRPAARPHLWLADGETDELESAYANETGVRAFFSGRGGDNVFFRTERLYGLADWIGSRGLGPQLLRRCWENAASTSRPFLDVVAEALRLASHPPDLAATGAPPTFLSRKAQSMLVPPQAGDTILPLGRRWHLRLIEDRLNYYDHRPHADYIYPLVSQPVIEACLNIPTYLLSPGGSDRGLARAAFAGLIDPLVLARRSKGQTSGYLGEILLRHLSFLRTLLLDGELASADMLDMDALAPALTEGGLMRHPENMPRIVGLMSVEAWLRNRPSFVGARGEAA